MSPEEIEAAALRESAAGGMHRREFVLGALALGAGALLPGCRKPAAKADAASGAGSGGIAIVGAGIAGLTAAHYLAKAGIEAEIFEAGMRAGGRIMTLQDVVAPGLWTEAGGEFIDSSHTEMMGLAAELGLPLQDMQGKEYAGLKEFAYHFGGRHRSEKEVIAEVRKAAARMKADMDALPDEIAAGTGGVAAELDRMSLEEYLHRRGITGWFHDLLVAAYVTEFGLEAGEQSCLNLLTMISLDVSKGRFDIFGESDERYRIQGGSQGVTEGLARLHAKALRFDHRLEALEAAGNGYRLSFRSQGKSVERRCDAVILALPFSLLRSVDIKVDLPPAKRKAIAELGYGTNSKLFLGFSTRPWRKAGYTGYFFTDGPMQSGWDHTLTQPGDAGGLTVYQGGAAGLALGAGSPKAIAEGFSGPLEALYPGSGAARNGNQSVFHWPTYPLSLGSYACYKPCQWTSVAGEEGRPFGNLFFAGEHCSTEFQGYMNGGAATGRAAAEAIIAKTASTKSA